MALANSFWLWGLSALTVPLIIHLLSRREGKVIRMGSLRYLQDSNTQQFKSLQLNEIVLFILRCLLIIILVLFLCSLLWPKSTNQKWVIMEDALKNNTTAIAWKDSLITQGYELHFLSNDFALDDKNIGHSYWSLAEHLKTNGIDDAVILSTSRAEGFRGERIGKSSLKWITVSNATEVDYAVAAIRKSNDSVTVINAQLDNDNTHYKKSIQASSVNKSFFISNKDSVSIQANDTLRVALVSSPAFSYDKKMMKALLNVIQQNTFRFVEINETNEASFNGNQKQTDWLIWLSEQPLPKTETKVIYFKEAPSLSIIQQQNASQWTLTQRLNKEVIINNGLSTLLTQLLLPENAIQQQADLKDQRTMPEQMMWSTTTDKSASGVNKASFISIDHYLVILFMLVWIAERLIAYKRNQ